jgi:hypothetical protein
MSKSSKTTFVTGSSYLLAVKRTKQWVCLATPRPCKRCREWYQEDERPDCHIGHPEELRVVVEPIGQLSRTSNGPRGLVTRFNNQHRDQRDPDGYGAEAYMIILNLDEAEREDVDVLEKIGDAERKMDAVGSRLVALQEASKVPVATVVKKPRRKRVKCEACAGEGEQATGRIDVELGLNITEDCKACKGEGTVLVAP